MTMAHARTSGRAERDVVRRLQALADISRLITLGLDQTAILQHVTEALARLLDSPYARLWMLDDATNDLVLVANAGALTTKDDLGLRRSGPDSVNRTVIASGRLYHTSDILAHPLWFNRAISERYGLHSYVGVPLAVQDRRLGVLTLLFPGHRAFDAEDLELVETVGAQASTALANARTYARMSTLTEISRMVSSSLDHQAVLDAAVEATARLLGVSDVRLWLVDETAKLLRLGARAPADAETASATLPLGDSLSGAIVRTGETRVIVDLVQEPLWRRRLPSDEQVVSGIFTPLVDRETPLGVVVALSQRRRAFNDEDVQLLRALVDQMAAAIRNARLYQDARRQAGQLAAILEVNKRLALGPQLEEILANIAEEAARLIGVEGASLRLVEGEELVTAATFGLGGSERSERLPLVGSLTGRVVTGNRPVISVYVPDDPRISPSRRAHAIARGLRSWVGVPLRGRERVLGTLTVRSRGERQCDDGDVGLLEAFAAQAAIAIENARLFQGAVRSRRHAEALREIGLSLTATPDPEQVLQRIAEEARRLVGGLFTFVVTPDTPYYRIVTVAGDDQGYGNVLKLSDDPDSPHGQGPLGRAIRTRRPTVYQDIFADETFVPWRSLAAARGIRSLVAVPLIVQGKPYGALLSYAPTADAYDVETMDLLASLGAQAAAALETARLFEQAASIEALRELAALKTEFLSTVSHELRTPLSLIHGYAELLAQRATRLSTGQVGEMAGEIQAGSRTMIRLVDDLLDFSRIDRGKLELQRRRVDVTAELRRLVETFRHQPGGERIQADLSGRLEAWVDVERLSQIVGNLLTNALRYAPSGAIVVGATRRHGDLCVQVTDEGPGIAPEDQQRLWEKFYRGSAALTSRSRGSGLGLAVVKHLVELHDGQAGLSSYPGRGTTFWFSLPGKASTSQPTDVDPSSECDASPTSEIA